MTGTIGIMLATLDYPPPPGGIQTVVKNLERGIGDEGHEPYLLYVDTGSFRKSARDLLPTPNLWYSAEAILRGKFIYQNVVYRNAKEAIQKYDPDVVHAMHIKMWPAIVAANEYDIPTVLTTHALELRDTTLTRTAVRDVDAVTAVSEFTKSLLNKSAPIEQRTPPIEVIPPSIDVHEFRKSEVSKQSKQGPVVTISRFAGRKNIETIIKAWKEMDPSEIGCRNLIIVGDGPNRDDLERLANGTSSIQFLGWVSREEKIQLLNEADAFVLVPERDDYDVEGFGIVYIEAQASNTPVVGSSHGGVPEAIGDAGVIVKNENDPKEVGDAICTVLNQEEIRSNCIEAARQRIDQFNIQPITQKYLSIYRRLISDL